MQLLKKKKLERLITNARYIYWNIGKRIFEEEQQGNDTEDCGTYQISFLANITTRIMQSFPSIKMVAIELLVPFISSWRKTFIRRGEKRVG